MREYTVSSQYRHWHYATVEELEAVKTAAHEAACARIRERRSAADAAASPGEAATKAELITRHEQDVYIRFLEWKASDYCKFFKFPIQVKVCAACCVVLNWLC
jgi:hypothetical protein